MILESIYIQFCIFGEVHSNQTKSNSWSEKVVKLNFETDFHFVLEGEALLKLETTKLTVPATEIKGYCCVKKNWTRTCYRRMSPGHKCLSLSHLSSPSFLSCCLSLSSSFLPFFHLILSFTNQELVVFFPCFCKVHCLWPLVNSSFLHSHLILLVILSNC